MHTTCTTLSPISDATIIFDLLVCLSKNACVAVQTCTSMQNAAVMLSMKLDKATSKRQHVRG
eukprot:740-Heterococcus_DN1.PRE.2